MSLGEGRVGLYGASAGGVDVDVPATPTPGSGSAVIAIGDPATGTLQNWDLYVREQGATEWDEVATGITASSQTIGDLDAETAYQYRVVPHVLVDGETIGSFTTTATPPIPLVQWAQIDGGQDMGSIINGGSVWFWNNAGPCTFEALVTNKEPYQVDGLQIPVESTWGSSSTMMGFAIQRAGVWQTEPTDVTPAAGSFDDIAVSLSPVMATTTPIAANEQFRFQQVLSAGVATPGKNFGTKYHPTTLTTAYSAMETGDHLGTTIDPSGIEIGPFPSRIFMRLVDTEIYAMGMFGDSTVGMVQPVAATYSDSKEGVWFRANEWLRSESRRVRAYSYGQGTAAWSTIQARVRANLATMQGKISRVCIQVWTWNTAWTSTEQAEAAWAEYLALEQEVLAAGFGCSPLILNPYTTRNDAGQIAAFGVLKAYAEAHPYGVVLDEIMGDTDWPNLPAAESEDNVHQNQTGSIRTAAATGAALLSVAAIDYPELAA